ncbi:TERF1-interacting nuclear factor 2 isoform X2 [Lissotriton helveticus]
METQEILLGHVSPQQLAAAASWHVVRCRRFAHFPHVLEFLEMMNAVAPDLVAYRHYAKLTLGLKAAIVVDMIRQNHSRRSIFILANKFFPNSDPAVHPHATQRDYTKISEVVKGFRDTLRHLPTDQRNWEQYIKAELEEEYGEVFLAALEKLLREYFIRLESTMHSPSIQQLQESITSTGRSLRSRKKDLCSSLSVLQRYFSDMGWSQCDQESLGMEMETPTASERQPRRLRRSGPQHLESSLTAASKTSGKMLCPQGGRNEVEMLDYHSKGMQHNKYTTMDENVLNCAFEMLPPSMQSPMGSCSPVKLSPLTDQRLSTPRKISQVHKVEPNPAAFSCNPGRDSSKQQNLEPSPNKQVKIFSASKSAPLHLLPSRSNMVTMDLKVSLVKLPSHYSQKTVLLSHAASETKPVALPPVDSNGKALTADLRVSLVKLSIPDFQKNVPQNLSETITGSQTPECPPKKTDSQIPTDSQVNTVYPSPVSPLQKSDTQTLCSPLTVPFAITDGCKEKTMDLKVSLVKLPSHYSQKTVLLSHAASETKPVALPPVDSNGKALTADLRVSLVKISITDFQKNVPQNLSETNTGSQTPECPPRKPVSQIPTDSQVNTVCPSPGSPLLKSDTQILCTPLMVPFVSADVCKEKTNCMAIEGVSTLWGLHEGNGCSTAGITKEHEKEEATKVVTPGINTRQYLSPFDQQCTPVLCSGSIIPVLASVGEGAVQSIARLRPALPSPMLKRRRLFRPEEVADLILEEPVMMGSREEKQLVSSTRCNNEPAVKLGLQDIPQVTEPCIVQSGVLSHDCKEGNGMWSSATKSSDSPYPAGSQKRARSPESLELPMQQLSPVGKRRDCNKVLSKEFNCPPDSAVSCGAVPEQYIVSKAEPGAVESSKLGATETSGLESDSDFLVASRTRTDPAAEQKENILLRPLCSADVIPPKTYRCESSTGDALSAMLLFPRPPQADTEVIMDSEDEESGGSNKGSLQNYHKTKFNTYIPTFREHFRRTFRCTKKQVAPMGCLRERRMYQK